MSAEPISTLAPFPGVETFARKVVVPSGFWPDEATVEEAEYLVADWIPTRAMAYLYGRHGSLKSFLTLHIAMCGALGLDVMGNAVPEAFGTVYCCGEKKSRFGKRVIAWTKANGVRKAPAVFTRDGCPDLTDELAVDDFIAEINDMKAAFESRGAPLKLVVLDTLSRAMKGGNVSDPTTAGLAIGSMQRIVDETGCTVIPVAHVAKSEGSDTIKGVGEFGDGAETYIFVERDKAAKIVTATLGKNSDGEDGLQFAYAFERVVVGHGRQGEISSGCVVAAELPEGGRRDRSRALSPKLALVLRAAHLCDQAGEGESVPTPPGIPPGTKGIHRNKVKLRAIAEGYDDGSLKPESLRRTLNSNITDLIGKERLRGAGDYVWVLS